MIISKGKVVCALNILGLPSCSAVRGVSSQCCELAKSSSAFINTTISQSSFKCGQRFSSTNAPAPDLSVSLSWCRDNCAGYALYPPSETNAWALPLVTFILAAVIFSMTIPRRLASRAPRLSLNLLPVSLVRDALILTLDTAFWVFTVMTATAPCILSGLFEIAIDYKVTRYASKADDNEQLSEAEIVELLTAVLAGNLTIEGVPVNPQQELKSSLDINGSKDDCREAISVRLSDMLDGQVSFSTTVGAPVLLYIGSFIYSIVSLSGTKGDKETARALAFGIWWMIIVHVSVISGSLLASNNPSTASIIFPSKRVPLSRSQRREYANSLPEVEDRIQAKIETYFPLSLNYNNRYEPVWMWTRGKNKALWLRGTEAWKRPWVRERMNLSARGWLFLIATSYTLVFLPCALAFWIEYATPPVGVGCRALTILVYTACQSIFIMLSAWSHFKAGCDIEFWRKHEVLDRLRHWVDVVGATVFLLPSLIAAIFTTFAGTLMQISGIYQNCWCSATFPSHAFVSLASDTAEDRRSSRYWSIVGYIAVISLFVVTYCGWWGQRYLRDVFLDHVHHR